MLASQAGDDAMSKFYILIDKLDERWVDDSIRFKLIRSLIESLKSFRKISNLKILIALRSDLLERVVQQTRDLGFHREKFADYFVTVKWTTQQLRELVNKRIACLFRGNILHETQSRFSTLFPNSISRNDPFDYIVERTLMRPRDVITFVNACIERAEGQYVVTANSVLEAEGDFSRKRREALENEWQSSFPSLGKMLDCLKAIDKISVKFEELCQKEAVQTLCQYICTEAKVDRDPLYGVASKVLNQTGGQHQLMQHVVSILYRVGAVGVKLKQNERFLYSHIDVPVLAIGEIDEDTRVRVHPMLHRALGFKN